MLHITRYAFGSRVTSEVQEIQRFVQLSGDFRRMEIQRIRSALGFGSRVTSEEWKSKEFVRLSGDFRRMEKTKFSWLLSSEEQRKIKIRLGCLGFLSVLGSWIYRFRLSFLGLWIYGFRLSISAFGYWALDRFPLRTYIEQIGFPLRIFG
ncbi:unnamed protein product [Rhizophagus irregularis]|nr:unnamed protein product [Rhizophagus irregularis]